MREERKIRRYARLPDARGVEYICIKYPETERTRLAVRLITTNISDLSQLLTHTTSQNTLTQLRVER